MTWLSLAEACERADGPLPSHVVGRLYSLASGVEFGFTCIVCGDDGRDELQVRDADMQWVWGGYRDDAVDVSINAIVALIVEKLPGWHVRLEIWIDGLSCDGTLYPLEDDPVRAYESHAATPALALCAAFCRAMAADDTPVSGREDRA